MHATGKRDRSPTLWEKKEEIYLHMHQNGLCYLCDGKLEEESYRVTHILSPKEGGGGELSNKCIVCLPCHHASLSSSSSDEVLATKEDTMHSILRRMQSQRPQQTHNRHSVDWVRDRWTSGMLVRAPCNRIPVWDDKKRRSYVLKVLEGRSTAPFYVNILRTEGNKRHVYDGINRLTALMDFMDGKLLIHLREGIRRVRIRASYASNPWTKDCCVLSEEERRNFRDRMLDFFEWDNLTEEEACDIAQLINLGTPMNNGERIQFLTAKSTPRAGMLKMLFQSEYFSPYKNRGDREHGLKALAIILRSMIDDTYTFSSCLTTNFHHISSFYSSHDPVPSEKVEDATRHFSGIAKVLHTREKTVYNLLVAHYALVSPYPCDVDAALRDGDMTIPPEEKVLRHTREE